MRNPCLDRSSPVPWPGRRRARDIEAITQEILDAKRRGGEAILTIGRCLTEAKQTLPHGGSGCPGSMSGWSFRRARRRGLCAWLREWSNPSSA